LVREFFFCPPKLGSTLEWEVNAGSDLKPGCVVCDGRNRCLKLAYGQHWRWMIVFHAATIRKKFMQCVQPPFSPCWTQRPPRPNDCRYCHEHHAHARAHSHTHTHAPIRTHTHTHTHKYKQKL